MSLVVYMTTGELKKDKRNQEPQCRKMTQKKNSKKRRERRNKDDLLILSLDD